MKSIYLTDSSSHESDANTQTHTHTNGTQTIIEGSKIKLWPLCESPVARFWFFVRSELDEKKSIKWR